MAYTLTYFDTQGRGEPIRFLLSYGGVDFNDVRIPKESWAKLKADTPFGQLPLLEHKGKTAHQSVAICRYLGKQFGLAGKNDWEDLEIDAAVDTAKDLFEKVGGGKKVTRATVEEQFRKEEVAFILKRLDEQIKKNNGYIAVGRLTWADLFICSSLIRKKDMFADYPNIQENIRIVENLPRIKEWISKHPATE